MERLIDTNNLERGLNNVSLSLISSPKQWVEMGLTGEQLNQTCISLSAMVQEYVAGHEGEMLVKDPGEIKLQFLKGDSVILVNQERGKLQVVGHGTNYINFENGEEHILGMQVTEVGTVIVDKRFQGLGLGKAGVRYLSEMALNGYNKVLRLATVKQAVTAKVFDDAGIVPVSFYDYPYLSYLTCTCENSSERCGFQSCQFRRQNSQSGEADFIQILNPSNRIGKIPCTLVLSDLSLAQEFEENCRRIDYEITGSFIEQGKISIESFRHTGLFFDIVKQLALSKKENEK